MDIEHDDVDEDREAASLARSTKILANEPSPEELLEQQERARRNGIERIMRGESETAPQPLVLVTRQPRLRERRDDAIQVDDGRADYSLGQLAGARAARGGARHRAALSADEVLAERWRTLARLVQRQPKAALGLDLLIRELAAQSVAAARVRNKLELRIAKLEAARKRVKRLKRRIASLEAGRKPRIRIASGRAPQ